jgi:hypothetical protein
VPVSKASDNEHTRASLGQVKELSVQDSVGEPIPEFDQPSEEGTKVPSSVRRQHAGDVLPHHPSGACAIKKLEKLEGQLTALVIHSASKAGDTERLTGSASDKKVNWAIFVALDRGEVAMKRRVGIVMFQDSARERLDLAIGGGFPSE